MCAACHGVGFLGNAPCATCRGRASAATVDGEVWYIGARLDRRGFAEWKRTGTFERGVGFATLLLAVGLLLFLVGFGVWTGADPFSHAFWTEPSLLAFLSSFFVLILCFLAYWMAQLSEETVSIPKAKFGHALGALAPASIPVSSGARNIMRSFDVSTIGFLSDIYHFADDLKNGTVSPAHVLAVACSNRETAALLARLGLTLDAVRAPLRERFSEIPASSDAPVFSPKLLEAFFAAYRRAALRRQAAVRPLDFFAEVVLRDAALQDILFNAGVALEQFQNAVLWMEMSDELRSWRRTFVEAAAEKPIGAMNRAMTSVPTPLLDRVSEDLTAEAAHGRLPLLVGRMSEMREMLRAMESGRRSVLLLGNAGVGKDALVAGLAIRMVLEDVPELLFDRRLVSISIPKLIAGHAPEEAEELLLTVLHEVGVAGNIILAILNIHMLAGGGAAGGVDLLETFAAELEKGYFVCVGTTTGEEYAKLIERRTLGQMLERVRIDPLSVNEAIQVLEAKAGSIEYEHGVFFRYDALEAAVKLSDRYSHDEPLPGKALVLIREAALHVAKARGKNAMVTCEDVAAILSEKTRVPVTQVTASESAILLDLEAKIQKRVIGQQAAVRAVASALRRARTELRSGKRPVGSFLFLGPTGVGKTELSKAVAAVYFGDERNMIRLDMSEYQDPKSIERLIGVPGSGVGGILTEAVRKNPFSLLLCDELEKAHPDILNLFLQVLDDGRLTDVLGRTVDFTNVVLIMTSNAGTQFIQDSVRSGMPLETIRARLLEQELRGTYRPEFLNRFDSVVVFAPLTMAEVAKIAELLILDFANRLEAKGITFTSSEPAIEKLAARGFDPLYGARPMRRLIQDTLENQIAEMLLRGDVRRGDTVVFEENGTLVVEGRQIPA